MTLTLQFSVVRLRRTWRTLPRASLCDRSLMLLGFVTRHSLPAAAAACLPPSRCIMDFAVLFFLLAPATLSSRAGVGGAGEGKAKLGAGRDAKGSLAERSVCSVPQVARVPCSVYVRRGPGTRLSLCIIKRGQWTATSSASRGCRPTSHLTRRYLP